MRAVGPWVVTHPGPIAYATGVCAQPPAPLGLARRCWLPLLCVVAVVVVSSSSSMMYGLRTYYYYCHYRMHRRLYGVRSSSVVPAPFASLAAPPHVLLQAAWT